MFLPKKRMLLTSTFYIVLNTILLLIIIGILVYHKFHHPHHHQPEQPPPVQQQRISPTPKKTDLPPRGPFRLAERELSFEEVGALLEEWHRQAPDHTRLGVVGDSSGGNPIRFIRIGKRRGPKVLVMAGIHGNEKLGVMTAICCMGKMLDSNLDLIESRDIFFIPISSPDAFIRNIRQQDGIDPNRNWGEEESIPSVEAIKNFQRMWRFHAMLSVHNYGGSYLHPWGCSPTPAPHNKEFRNVVGQMANMTGYKPNQIFGQSSPPYSGYEVDWFYTRGVFSLVVEIGRRFEALPQEIQADTRRNYPSFVFFVEQAPLQIKLGSDDVHQASVVSAVSLTTLGRLSR
jgi:hypothetical protein